MEFLYGLKPWVLYVGAVILIAALLGGGYLVFFTVGAVQCRSNGGEIHMNGIQPRCFIDASGSKPRIPEGLVLDAGRN